MVDYSALSPAQLIGLLEARDATPQDKEILALKIQRKIDAIAKKQARILEINEIGILSPVEKSTLADLHNLDILNLQANVDQLQAILDMIP